MAHPVPAAAEDEDFDDFNIVFDEIGALQKKGLDESEDDVVGPLASVAQLGSTLHHLQQQQTSLNHQTHHNTNNNNNHVPSQPPHHAHSAVLQTSDGKIITYNPELYDEEDITLAKEKFPLNVR